VPIDRPGQVLSVARVTNRSAPPRSPRRVIQAVRSGLAPYLAIARPDHWTKNAFMALGILLAYFYRPEVLLQPVLVPLLLAVLATCLLASSNYVLNELLDRETDRHHPAKRWRSVPAGQVRLPLACAEWLLLAAVGLAVAAQVNWPFFWSGLLLLAMGVVYNVPPLRAKELPYLDVLSESLNNPIRLLLGWFALNPVEIPPISLLIAYWMIGAFLMAAKRFAEYRALADRTTAIHYRRSFYFYDEQTLLVSMFFYVTMFALFLGVFVVRYHLELILSVPLVAGFVCYYLAIALRPDSPAQRPERLYREQRLLAYVVLCVVVFVGLMFVQIPVLYTWFNVSSTSLAPLWRLQW
jgi:decaprenyl-phosphate phosphoribosyltransferase